MLEGLREGVETLDLVEIPAHERLHRVPIDHIGDHVGGSTGEHLAVYGFQLQPEVLGEVDLGHGRHPLAGIVGGCVVEDRRTGGGPHSLEELGAVHQVRFSFHHE